MTDTFWFGYFGRLLFVLILEPYNPLWSEDAQLLLDKLEANDAA